MTYLKSLCLIVCCVAQAFSQDAPPQPRTVGLDACILELTDEGKLEVSFITKRRVKRTRRIVSEGVKSLTPEGAPETITEFVEIASISSTTYRFSEFEAERVDGEKVSQEELKSAASKPTAAIFLYKGDTIHPQMRRLLKPDTLIIRTRMPVFAPNGDEASE